MKTAPDNPISEQLLSFIDRSPTAFHAIDSIVHTLEKNGFTERSESDDTPLTEGGKYYTVRNHSSILAYRIPHKTPTGFMIVASHSDSPTFKIKASGEIVAFQRYKKLNTERYGGMILSSWFDRPLSVAGRVAIDDENGICTKLVNIDKDLLVIPNVAIHMNRTINDGYKYNPAVDTLPLMAESDTKTGLMSLLSECLHIPEDKIIGHDLFLYAREKGKLVGAENEFILSPRIDNLECAFTSLMGFLNAENTEAIPVYAVFDNEETGSETKQGAASDFLFNTLHSIADCLPVRGSYRRMETNSFMLSADNAHARHPNHPELADWDNAPHMNGGVVIKFNAAQRYTTDGVSAALFRKICHKANVPVQFFANRSDMAGGSTLGSISNTKVSIQTVDIGLAQLAMHSACETAGSRDAAHMVKATQEFFSSAIVCQGDSLVLLNC